MQEEVITNKQMTMVAHFPCNSDRWPMTKHISESSHESQMPQDKAHHSKDHFSWRKKRSSNENYVSKLSYRAGPGWTPLISGSAYYHCTHGYQMGWMNISKLQATYLTDYPT
ncbi:hypothetical protein L1987_20432 [Smallanthus sonchifolius]|uniref:Uncharacterized protein n=1 Tax=Smallanthus sonchifolius TaxID=185202 RepID=A0ACB9IS35_9ASTR|nr:hypothetical protein L1987_20432 [Smallanthus sonchifolius]